MLSSHFIDEDTEAQGSRTARERQAGGPQSSHPHPNSSGVLSVDQGDDKASQAGWRTQ